ncbi:MAG: Duplicated orphan permease [Mucilaginibacter sp.]|nr:Duplicated orphan permease [Mucilaginibacter sp.]
MIKNYLKVAFRNLVRNKAFSLINIFGLAIGIVCTGLIFLWVENEVQYDNVNVKKDRLYMVLNTWIFDGHYKTYESTPGPLAAAMKAEIPGVANTCRYTNDLNNSLFGIGDKAMYAGGVYADSSVFNILTLPFLQGNAKSAFKQLYSIVITEKTARKFFGNTKNVVGRTVKVDNKQDYIVTGIIKDFPQNTTLQFEWIAPFDIFLKENPRLNYWQSNSIITLAELSSNANVDAVKRQLYRFAAKKEADNKLSSTLFSMNDWHLRWSFENGKQTGGGRIQYVHMFAIIAWIILFLACINFMNLATARSEKRAKEVGVRKVLGSGKHRLILQFMGEAMLMALLAVIAAILIITLVLPAFNTLTQKELALELANPLHLAALATITIICGLVAGSYPSLYLSSFNPISVLKGLQLKKGSAGFIRKGLVVLQFTISIVLIISTVIIYQQIRHLKSRDLGYNKNNLIVIPSQGDMGKNFNAIKQDLLNTGIVENAALADHETIYGGQNNDDYTWDGKDPNSKVLISHRGVSPELLKTCDIKVIRGRGFNTNPATDSMNIIITESLAKMLKTENVLSETIREGNSNYHIIGVVRDFLYGDMLGSKSDPLIFFCTPDYGDDGLMYVRLKKQINTEQALAKIQAVIKRDNPSYPFTYKFVDDEFNQMFLSEMLVSRLSRIFAGLAVIISCLGLFGLAAYTTERRTKEIGIRKVLGASVGALASLLSGDFIKLVFISSLLAFPVAWYAMNTWLQNYAYHITINWLVFAAAGVAAIVITLITVSFQSIKAALMNPVKSLRSE